MSQLSLMVCQTVWIMMSALQFKVPCELKRQPSRISKASPRSIFFTAVLNSSTVMPGCSDLSHSSIILVGRHFGLFAARSNSSYTLFGTPRRKARFLQFLTPGDFLLSRLLTLFRKSESGLKTAARRSSSVSYNNNVTLIIITILLIYIYQFHHL